MEIHLADKLGVSRTPIREAIRKLELEGLVTMIPRRGAEVAQITEKNLRDVLEVRRALDALAVELACERITEDELAELKKSVRELRTGNKARQRQPGCTGGRGAARYYFKGERKRAADADDQQAFSADVPLPPGICQGRGKLQTPDRRAPRDLRGDPRPRQTDWSRGDQKPY